jgi:hypothetical protein
MQYVDAETEMDPDLLNSLSRVVARKRLMLTLEKGRANRDAQLADTAQANAEEEEARWTAPRLEVDGSTLRLDSEQDSKIKRGFFVRRYLPVRRPVSIIQEPTIEQDGKLEADLEYSESNQRQETAVEQDPPGTASSTTFVHANQSNPTFKLGRTIEGAPMQRAIAGASKPTDKPKAVTKTPRPLEIRENPLDPDVQYRKLQEQLGLVAPSSSGESNFSPPITSFGATLGYKSKDSIERKRQQHLAVRVRRVAPGIGPKT